MDEGAGQNCFQESIFIDPDGCCPPCIQKLLYPPSQYSIVPHHKTFLSLFLLPFENILPSHFNLSSIFPLSFFYYIFLFLFLVIPFVFSPEMITAENRDGSGCTFADLKIEQSRLQVGTDVTLM
jgi:hypothetical protein